jgi:hypothetical protein
MAGRFTIEDDSREPVGRVLPNQQRFSIEDAPPTQQPAHARLLNPDILNQSADFEQGEPAPVQAAQPQPVSTPTPQQVRQVLTGPLSSARSKLFTPQSTLQLNDPNAASARRQLQPIANIIQHPVGAAISGAMGVAKDVTLGAINTDEATQAMPSLGLTPSPLAEGVGEFAGVFAPWEGIASAVSGAFNLANAGRVGRIATQAATGAIVGATEAGNKGEDIADNAALGGATAGALTGALEIPSVVRESNWWRMLTNKERGLVVQTMDDIKAGLKSLGWDEGQVNAKLARIDPETFQTELKKRMQGEGVQPAPAPKEAAKVTPAPEAETPRFTIEPEPAETPAEVVPDRAAELQAKIKARRESAPPLPQEAETVDSTSNAGVPKAQEPAAEAISAESEGVSLQPAVKLPDGTIVSGDLETRHDDILKSEGVEPGTGNIERGFVKDGEFLTRGEAMADVAETAPEVHKELAAAGISELHSADLETAVKKVRKKAVKKNPELEAYWNNKAEADKLSNTADDSGKQVDHAAAEEAHDALAKAHEGSSYAKYHEDMAEYHRGLASTEISENKKVKTDALSNMQNTDEVGRDNVGLSGLQDESTGVKRTFEPKEISSDSLPEDTAKLLPSKAEKGKYYHATHEAVQKHVDTHGDGFLYRVANISGIDAGADVGMTDYKHQFGDTSAKTHSFTTSLEDAKQLLAESENSDKMIVYKIKPKDLHGEFTVQIPSERGKDNALHIQSPVPAQIEKATAVYRRGEWLEGVSNDSQGTDGRRGNAETSEAAGQELDVRHDQAPGRAGSESTTEIKPLDHGVLNLPLGSRARGGSIDAQLDKYKKEQAKIEKAASADKSAQTKSDKAEARTHKPLIETIARQTSEKGKVSYRDAFDTLDSMMKWEPKKFIGLVEKWKAEQPITVRKPVGGTTTMTLDEATKLVQESVDSGKVRPVPFQIHNEFDISLGDADRIIAGLKTTPVPTFSEAKEGEIYQTKVNRDGETVTMYAVPHGKERGFGDTLHMTYEEAQQEQVRYNEQQAANAEYQAKRVEKEAAEKKAADAVKAERGDLDGFGSELSPMHLAKAVEALNKAVQVDGKPTTIKAQVKKLVEAGELATTEQHDKIKPMTRTQFNRATQKEQDAHDNRVKEAGKKTVYYVGDFDLGKTAYDYAQYLIEKGPTVKESLTVPEEPIFDTKKERALTEEVRALEKKLDNLRDKHHKDGRASMVPPAIRAEQLKNIEKLSDVLGAKQEELAKMYSDFREAEAAFESDLPSAETATVPETVPASSMEDEFGNFISREKNGTYKVWKRDLTHSKLYATIGYEGEKGIAKATELLNRLTSETKPKKPMRMDGTTRPDKPVKEPLPGFSAMPEMTQEKFNTAWTERDIPKLKEYLGLDNKNLRAEFEHRTGEKLPKTVKGTDATIEEYFTRANLDEEISGMTTSEIIREQVDQKAEIALAKQKLNNPQFKGASPSPQDLQVLAYREKRLEMLNEALDAKLEEPTDNLTEPPESAVYLTTLPESSAEPKDYTIAAQRPGMTKDDLKSVADVVQAFKDGKITYADGKYNTRRYDQEGTYYEKLDKGLADIPADAKITVAKDKVTIIVKGEPLTDEQKAHNIEEAKLMTDKAEVWRKKAADLKANGYAEGEFAKKPNPNNVDEADYLKHEVNLLESKADQLSVEANNFLKTKSNDIKHVFYFEGDRRQQAVDAGGELLSLRGTRSLSSKVTEEARQAMKSLAGMDKAFKENPQFKVMDTDNGLMLVYENGKHTMRLYPEAFNLDRAGKNDITTKETDGTMLKVGDTVRLSPGYLENKTDEVYLIPKGEEGDTFYSGIDPAAVVKSLSGLKENLKEDLPKLAELGRQAFNEGKNKFEDFRVWMKDKLGDMWDRFKGYMEKVWDGVRSAHNTLLNNERGAVGDLRGESLRRYHATLDKVDKAVAAEDYAAADRLIAEADELADQAKPQDVSDVPRADITPEQARASVHPKGNGETKSRGLSLSIETDAVDAGIIGKRGELGALPAYEVRNKPEMAIKEFVDADETRAKRISDGSEPPPYGILRAEIFTELRKRATIAGDSSALMDLLNSPMAERATELGREIQALDAQVDISDPFVAMQDIAEARAERAKKMGIKVKPDEQAAEIDRLKTELDTAKAALDAKYSDSAIKKMRKEVNKNLTGTAKKTALDTELKGLVGQLNALLSRVNLGIDPAAAKILLAIAKNRVEAGVNTASGVIDSVYHEVKGALKGVKKRDIRDALSNYGKTRELDREEVATTLRELKRKWLIASKIEDDKKGNIPKLTGVEREAKSDKLRSMEKELDQFMKKNGLDNIFSTEGHIKTAQDTIRTKLTNDITDLDRQIKAEKRDPVAKTGVKYNANNMALLAVRNAKAVALEAIDARVHPELTDQQRIDRAINSIEISSEMLRREIATGIEEAKKESKTPQTPEIIKLKSERDALRKTRDEKRALRAEMQEKGVPDEDPLVTAAIKFIRETEMKVRQKEAALDKAIKENRRRIADNDLHPEKKPSGTPDTPSISENQAVLDDLNTTIKQMRKEADPPKDPEEAKQSARKTWLTNQIAKFEKIMETGEFPEEVKKPPTRLDAEGNKLKSEYDQAKENYRAAVDASGTITKEEAAEIVRLSKIAASAKAAIETGGSRFDYGSARVNYENYVNGLKGADDPLKVLLNNRIQEAKTTWGTNKPRAILEAGKDTLGAITNNSIAMVASFDNSFMGRQGLKTLFTHPSAWYPGAKKSFSDFVQTIGGVNAHDAMLADIYSRPNYLNGEYQKAKIIAKNEEQYPTSLPERVPYLGVVFKASEIAFKGSALRMRTDLYDMLSAKARDNGVDLEDKVQIEALGKLINSLTARGQWGKTGEPAVVRLVLWAPKMLKANIDVLTGHNLGSGLESEFARKEAATNLLKIIAVTAAVMAIANAILPGSAELDPRSADFGKIKIGTTRFDITGGASSLITLAARIITRSTKSTETGLITPYGTGYGQRSPFDALIDFLNNKTTPPVGIVASWLKGRNRSGDPFTWSNAAYSAFTPISIQNLIQIGDDPSADKIAGALVDLIGLNANSYTDDGTQRSDFVSRLRRGKSLNKTQRKAYDQLSDRQKKNISDDSKVSALASKAKKMNIDQLADIMENAPSKVTDEVLPEFRKKFRSSKDLTPENRERYLDILRSNR